jgi:hypothetical protein
MQTMVKACIDHKSGLPPGVHNIAIDIIPNALSPGPAHIVSQTFFSRVRQTARINLPLGGSQRRVSVRI